IRRRSFAPRPRWWLEYLETRASPDGLAGCEIFFGDGAGALHQEGGQLARRLAALPCMHPAEISCAARGEKQRQPRQRRLRHLPFAAIAADECLASRRVDAVARDEIQ